MRFKKNGIYLMNWDILKSRPCLTRCLINCNFFHLRCICCPQETKHSEDIKLRAILDRLDDMEAKLMDTSQSHVTGVDLPSEQENDYVAFSETSELFEGARDRGIKFNVLLTNCYCFEYVFIETIKVH